MAIKPSFKEMNLGAIYQQLGPFAKSLKTSSAFLTCSVSLSSLSAKVAAV
ncbi:hypothetical protein J2T17_005004 [Paenibacillus mucilaginosus]